MSQDIATAPPESSIPVILDRPAWGRVGLGLRALQERLDDIVECAAAIEAQGGGLLALSYAEDYEPTALLLVSLLFGRFRSQGKQVQLYRAQLEPNLPTAFPPSGYVVVHHLPEHAGLVEILEGSGCSGRVVIATGLRHAWEQLPELLPTVFLSPFAGTNDTPAGLETAIQEELAGYRGLGEDTRAYFLVALFDAWGIPLPFDLLARALGRDEDDVGDLVEQATQQELLFWIELEKPPALLVSTKAPLIARTMVEQVMGDTAVLQSYADVIRAVDPHKKDERYTILKLFQALLRGGVQWDDKRWGIQQPRRRWVRALFEDHYAIIEPLWQQGDATEVLLWGKLYENLKEFEQSETIFLHGLARDDENIYLRQARARMLAAWARVVPAKYGDADTAFQNAAQVASENPYVWHAWGVMDAQHGKVVQARRHFERALRSAQRKSERLYTWVAWADFELEHGQNDQARQLLENAKNLGWQSPYVLHVDGKRAFYAGDYQQAEALLKAVFEIDPVNVVAHHSLGNMAVKRGHWNTAEGFLHQALEIDAENVPTLHTLGDLWAERGHYAVEQGQTADAQTCYQRAAQHYQTILLELEPLNVWTLVAYGVLLRHWAQLDPDKYADADTQLQHALNQELSNHFALHALGELYFQQEKLEEAESLFQEIVQHHEHNRNFSAQLVPRLTLARLKQAQGISEHARQQLDFVDQIMRAVSTNQAPSLPQHDMIKVYNTWATCELEAGNLERAEHLVQSEALRRDSDNAYTCRLYARILHAMGRESEARTYQAQAQALAEADA